MVFRAIVTALDVFYAIALMYFVNSKNYSNDKLSKWVFGTMVFSFALSAIMMWR